MGTSLSTLIALGINGLVYGAILFLLSVGLTVTLGLMRMLNLAHCAFAMVGGYFAWALSARGGLSFYAAVPLAVLGTVALGYVLERTVYQWVYRATELGQVLITIGLTFVAIALINLAFGGLMQQVAVPPALSGQMQVGPATVPVYRIFLLGVSGLVALALWLGLERTGFGARLRATVDNKRMASCVGIHVERLLSITFALGCGLAALGGALGSQILPLEPFYGLKHLILVLIVVAVGGLGSLQGSAIAAVGLGIIDTLGRYYLPEIGGFLLYGLVLVLLLIRPQGLMGRAA
ncbi:branched-chain amino acid ABC transporter permease [Ramlibacter sp. AW1]|uniref:Branched-chain amino acid ABC transporter permease n=1 Tax=Ramlibacter aurantiacus TaxID=2801330 RepID=A0A936ZPG4_9BURK|nr:branched-chain amino acid ABC transporter permease [Ramlibacter aurantiacus]MBL0420041.1 branched-chain amino acid ABC transporter permease [Ramlibacter aurantiacus]